MPIQNAQLARVVAREIAAVKAEVLGYPDDASLWTELPGLPNSGGTLALHLAGNLRHFIGRGMGGSEYVRDRDAEFKTRGISRTDVAALIDAAATEVAAAFATAPADFVDLAPPMQMPNGAKIQMPVGVLHLMAHLAYHLGQLDYHRRSVTGQVAGVGAMDIMKLAD